MAITNIISVLMVASVVAASNIHPVMGILTAIFMWPVHLWVYVRTHNFYHQPKPSLAYELSGTIATAFSGYSWNIYKATHRNHHQHNNGPRDATVTFKNGEVIGGAQYLWKNSIKPWFFQQLPFSYWFVLPYFRKSKAIIVDEVLKLVVKFIAFYFAGWAGVLGVLVLNLMNFIQLGYGNYLQHFDRPEGHAHDWNHTLLNRIYVNFGMHECHHKHPRRLWNELEHIDGKEGCTISFYAIFSPFSFVRFLISPESLRKTFSGLS